MAKKTTSSATGGTNPPHPGPDPIEYPMNPQYLKDIIVHFKTKPAKKAVKAALSKYRKACNKAEKELIIAILKHR
jgi:hypothetical protein